MLAWFDWIEELFKTWSGFLFNSDCVNLSTYEQVCKLPQPVSNSGEHAFAWTCVIYWVLVLSTEDFQAYIVFY